MCQHRWRWTFARHAAWLRGDLTEAQWGRLEVDLDCCLELDRFDFAMVVERRAGLLVMQAVTEPGARVP